MSTFTTEQTVANVFEAMSKRPNRTFATVEAALATFQYESRYIGMSAFIVAKKTTYRFVGGIEDMDFVPDAMSRFLWKTTSNN